MGAGAFGTALAKILEENYHAVNFYDPLKHPEVTISAATGNADFIIFAAPSDAAEELLSELPKTTPLINASKGFLSLRPFFQLQYFSVISGATFAEDILAGKPVKFTTNDKTTAKLFKNSRVSFDFSEDILGIMLCGSFKNIYAIGAGMRKLTQDTPEFKKYIQACLLELRAILAANNCNPETAELSCGKEDLLLTCGSEKSRNYQYGLTGAAEGTVEGVITAELLKTSDLTLPEELPILNNILEKIYATQ